MAKQEDTFDEELIDELEAETQAEEEDLRKYPREVPTEPRVAKPRPMASPSRPINRNVIREPPALQRARAAQPRYTIFQQPEIIGIKDEETGEIIAQGFTNQGELMAAARILNVQEEIRRNTYVA